MMKKKKSVTLATSSMVGREDKRTNNGRTTLPTLKNNAAASYRDPVKIDLLKCTCALVVWQAVKVPVH